MSTPTGNVNWRNGRIAVAGASLIGLAYLLILVLPYVQLEIKAQGLMCGTGLHQACGLSTGIVASRLAAVVFQYGFLALPCWVLALRGHRRTFTLPLLIPAVGALFVTGLRNWVFAFALPTASWLGFMERTSSTWHWHAPVWESHWALASLFALVLSALPAALVASRHPAETRTSVTLEERATAVGAGVVLAGASLFAIGFVKPQSWPTAQIPEAFIFGLFVLAIVLRGSIRTSVVVFGTLGALAWADLALFTVLRLGLSEFGTSGLLQVLPTLVLSFVVIGLAGSMSGPIAKRLLNRRGTDQVLAALG